MMGTTVTKHRDMALTETWLTPQDSDSSLVIDRFGPLPYSMWGKFNSI